jgi:hypothetical protein
MTVYIQTGENNRITDIITYPHEGYIETEVALPLPTGVLGGAYELRDSMIIYRPEWDKNEKITKLEEEIEELRNIVAELQGEPKP